MHGRRVDNAPIDPRHIQWHRPRVSATVGTVVALMLAAMLVTSFGGIAASTVDGDAARAGVRTSALEGAPATPNMPMLATAVTFVAERSYAKQPTWRWAPLLGWLVAVVGLAGPARPQPGVRSTDTPCLPRAAIGLWPSRRGPPTR